MSFAVHGLPFSQKRQVVSSIQQNGGTHSLFINSSVKYVITEQQHITSYLELQSSNLGFSLVTPAFLDEWSKNGSESDVTPFLIKTTPKTEFVSVEAEPESTESLSSSSSLASSSNSLTGSGSLASKPKQMVKGRKGKTTALTNLVGSGPATVPVIVVEQQATPSFDAIPEFRNIYSLSYSQQRSVQLGHTSDILDKGVLVQLPVSHQNKIKQFSAGATHSALLTTEGVLFTWGEGRFGKLGHGGEAKAVIPTEVSLGTKVSQVSCGPKHTAALTEIGQFWHWGAIDKENSTARPDTATAINKELRALKEVPKTVSCGNGVTGIITESGKLYLVGNNRHLILDKNQNGELTLIPITEKVVSVAFGESHAIALTEDGYMHSWGMNKDGECGIGDAFPVKTVHMVLSSFKAKSIACAKNHSACVSENGTIFTWGKRLAAVKIDGERSGAFTTPQPIRTSEAWAPVFAEVGFGQDSVVALSEDGSIYKWKLDIVGQQEFLQPALVHYSTATHMSCGLHNLHFLVSGQMNPFFQFCRDGSLELLKLAFEHDHLPLDLEDEKGNTLVHLSVLGRQPEVFEYLMTKTQQTNFNPSFFWKKNSDGFDPVLLMIDQGYTSCMEAMIAHGVPMSFTNADGNSGLHLAVFRQDLDLTTDLIRGGCNLDLQNHLGDTALHIAVRQREWVFIELLAQAGASLTLENKKGKTPIQECGPIRAQTISQFTKVNNLIIAGAGSNAFASRWRNQLAAAGIRTDSGRWRTDCLDLKWEDYDVVFVVLSPSTFKSHQCFYQVTLARANQKRIVPVWHIQCDIPKKFQAILPKCPFDLSGDETQKKIQTEKIITSLKEFYQALTQNPHSRSNKVTMVPEPLKIKKKKGLESDERKVRIFVSSTFSDMKVERTILNNSVFPQIKHLCEKRGIDFSFVDLQWGITEAMAKDGEVLTTCLREVERSYPFFISILGERYGWHQVSDEDELLETTLNKAIENGQTWLNSFRDRSVTELEIIHGALRFLPMREADETAKYQPIDYLYNHVSPEDKERQLSKLNTFFYFRHPSYAETQTSAQKYLFQSENSHARARLEELKARIVMSELPNAPYRKPFDFEKVVLSDLKKAILKKFPESHYNQNLHEQDVLFQNSFAKQKSKYFVGEQQDLSQVHNYLNGITELPLLVTSGFGEGKSAMLGFTMRRYKKMNPSELVVGFFCGLSMSSLQPWQICRYVIEEIQSHYQVSKDELEIPVDPDAFLLALPAWLEIASVRNGMLLVIDGLDKLEDIKDLDWLPSSLASNIKMILSATFDSEPYDKLVARKCSVVNLQPLTGDQKAAILTKFGVKNSKHLERPQRKLLIDARVTSHPLCLMTILDELSHIGTFDDLTDLLSSYVENEDETTENVEMFEQLFQFVLKRWESTYGREFVSSILSLFYITGTGISEYELLHLSKISHKGWITFQTYLGDKVVRKNGFYSLQSQFRNIVSTLYSSYFEEWRKDFAEYLLKEEMNERIAFELIHLYITSTPPKLPELVDLLSNIKVLTIMATDQNRPLLSKHWKFILDTRRPEYGAFQAQGQLLKTAADKEALALDYTETLRGLTGYHEKHGQYSIALRISDEGIQNIESLLGLDHASLVEALHEQSTVLGRTGNLQLAKDVAQRGLILAERSFGPNSVQTSHCVMALGVACKKMQSYLEAIPYLKRALQIRQKIFGKNHLMNAYVLNNIANLLAKMKIFNQAETTYKAALAILLPIFGNFHPLIATNQYNTGKLYQKQKLNARAIRHLKMSEEIIETVYGSEHKMLKKIRYQLDLAGYVEGSELAVEVPCNETNQIPDLPPAVQTVEEEKANQKLINASSAVLSANIEEYEEPFEIFDEPRAVLQQQITSIREVQASGYDSGHDADTDEDEACCFDLFG